MLCRVCGSEFNSENFDLCPYCLTPVKQEMQEEKGVAAEPVDQNIDDNSDESIDETSAEAMLSSENILEEDYEVTEADLIEDDDQNDEQTDISIDDLGLSVRAVNAFRRAKIFTLSELMRFLATNSVCDLKNVGAKTAEETEELLRKIQDNGTEFLKNSKESKPIVIDTKPFENMSIDADYLRIDALIELGFPNKAVNNLAKNNIKCCGELRYLLFNEIVEICGRRYEEQLSTVANLLEQDIITLLGITLDKHKSEREYSVFLRRAKGETLQEIADNPVGKEESVITRERVRQIEKSFIRSISAFVRELFFILKGNNNYVTVQDLIDIYDDDEYDQIILHACKGFEEFEYLDFAGIFVERSEEHSIEDDIWSIISDIAGEGIDVNESKDIIEDALAENQYEYVSIDAVEGLLKKHNYYSYGAFYRQA